MSVIGKIFRQNIGIKIASILLALLVFFYVRAQKEAELTFKVGVELKGIPDSLTWTGNVPHHVSVTLSGKLRHLIKLRLISLRIPVDLSRTGPGRFQRTLSAADVPLSEGSNVAVTHFAGPELIDITIEKKVSKTVCVVPVVVGRPAKNFALKTPVVAVPDTVSVSGAASVVASIDSVLTQPVDVSQRKQPFSARVRLNLGGAGLVCVTPSVEVFVSVGAESLDVGEKPTRPASGR